jgi:hypothetical protein
MARRGFKDHLLTDSGTTGLQSTPSAEASHSAKASAQDREFADDLLRGADEIAGFLLGDREERRAVYHLWATSKLPMFKLGSTLCARKSVLIKFIEDQERRSRKDEDSTSPES